LDRTGLLPGDVARGGAGCGEAEDEQHLAGTALLLLRGRLEDGRADVALALLELLARRVDSGPQHGAGGLHGLAGAREVVVLHVMAELVGTGAEVGRDLVGLLRRRCWASGAYWSYSSVARVRASRAPSVTAGPTVAASFCSSSTAFSAFCALAPAASAVFSACFLAFLVSRLLV